MILPNDSVMRQVFRQQYVDEAWGRHTFVTDREVDDKAAGERDDVAQLLPASGRRR